MNSSNKNDLTQCYLCEGPSAAWDNCFCCGRPICKQHDFGRAFSQFVISVTVYNENFLSKHEAEEGFISVCPECAKFCRSTPIDLKKVKKMLQVQILNWKFAVKQRRESEDDTKDS